MNTINKKLKELYSKTWKELLYKLDSDETLVASAYPLLISINEEMYNNSNLKIMVFGQEADGWDVYDGTIESLLNYYYLFTDSENNFNVKRQGPFWRGTKHLMNAFREENKPYLIYNNIIKIGQLAKPGMPPPKNIEIERKYFSVITAELEILKPDICIFLTGAGPDDESDFKQSAYNKIIMDVFEGITFEQVQTDIPKRELMRLHHPLLPQNKSFLTFHPRGLLSNQKRASKWNYLNLIAGYSMGYNYPHSMKKFKLQMQELSQELDLQFSSSDLLGQADSGFYFYRKNWKNCVIGFEFEGSWAGDFFYGICNMEGVLEIPASTKKEIAKSFGGGDGSTPLWPWYKYHEKKNWGKHTFREIEAGDSIKDSIRNILTEILEKLKIVEM